MGEGPTPVVSFQVHPAVVVAVVAFAFVVVVVVVVVVVAAALHFGVSKE